MYMVPPYGLLHRGHLGVGERLISKARRSFSMLTLCLPEGNMSKEVQHSKHLRY